MTCYGDVCAFGGWLRLVLAGIRICSNYFFQQPLYSHCQAFATFFCKHVFYVKLFFHASLVLCTASHHAAMPHWACGVLGFLLCLNAFAAHVSVHRFTLLQLYLRRKVRRMHREKGKSCLGRCPENRTILWLKFKIAKVVCPV